MTPWTLTRKRSGGAELSVVQICLDNFVERVCRLRAELRRLAKVHAAVNPPEAAVRDRAPGSALVRSPDRFAEWLELGAL